MNIGFNSYVVLKAISMVESKGNQFCNLMSMTNNIHQNLKFNVQSLENINFWRNFYTIPINEIEEIINELIKEKIVYKKTVQTEDKCFSMLFLTNKGKKILHLLDKKYYYIVEKNSFANNEDWDIIKEKTDIIYNFFSY